METARDIDTSLKIRADQDGYTLLRKSINTKWIMTNGVYVAREKKTQKLALCKILNYRGSTVGVQEVNVLLQAEGQRNIVRILKESHDHSEHRLYLEYCDGGSLRDLLQQYHAARRHIPEAFLWHVAESLLRALCFLHLGILQGSSNLTSRHDWAPIYHGRVELDHLYVATPPWSPDPVSYPRIVLGEFNSVYVGTPRHYRVGKKWRLDPTIDFFTMLHRKIPMQGEDQYNDWAENEWFRGYDVRCFASIMCELSYTNHETLRRTDYREHVYSAEWMHLVSQLNWVLEIPLHDWTNTPTVDNILLEVLRTKDSALARIPKKPLVWKYHTI